MDWKALAKRILNSPKVIGGAVVSFLLLVLGIQRRRIRRQDEEIRKANEIISRQNGEFGRIADAQSRIREIDKRKTPERTGAPCDDKERLARLNGVPDDKGGQGGR